MKMPASSPKQPSFSPRHRWKIGFDVAVRTALVLAVVVMANYLGAVLPPLLPEFADTR
jgi:hypothetical protein